jgi:hypothetical protein
MADADAASAPEENASAAAAAVEAEDDDCCAVCASAPRSVVFTTCGHAVLCAECCTKLLASKRQKCPVCREPVCADTAKPFTHDAALGRAPSFQPDAIDPAVRAERAAREEARLFRTRTKAALNALRSASEAPGHACSTDMLLCDEQAGLRLCVEGVTHAEQAAGDALDTDEAQPHGVPLRLPLSEGAVAALRAAAERAPFGRDADTVVDPAVRDAWQIDPVRVHLQGAWGPEVLDHFTAYALDTLRVPPECMAEARLYKLVVYGPGGHFRRHRDTEKEPGMFGTLVLQLPVDGGHQGGKLRVYPPGDNDSDDDMEEEACAEERPPARRAEPAPFVVDFACESDVCFVSAAFFADCSHTLSRVTAGARVCLVYSLVATAPGTALPAPGDAAADARCELRTALAAWPARPARLFLPCAHRYTEVNVGFGCLKGQDARLAAELRDLRSDAASMPLLEVCLVLLERHDSGDDEGSLQHDGTGAIAWVGPDGEQLGAMGPDPYQGARGLRSPQPEPDKEELLHGDELDFPEEAYRRTRSRYTGNEGPSVDYYYRRAALVVWPRQRGPQLAMRGGGRSAALDLAFARAKRGDADATDAFIAAVDSEQPWRAEDAWSDRRMGPWRGHRNLAISVLRVAARIGTPDVAPIAIAVIHALAEQNGDGLHDACVEPLAVLAATPAGGGADTTSALAALVHAAVSRNQAAACEALVAELLARDLVSAAERCAEAMLASGEAAEERDGGDATRHALQRAGPLQELALRSFTEAVAKTRARVVQAAEHAVKAAKQAAQRGAVPLLESGSESEAVSADGTWEGSSRDGSHDPDAEYDEDHY